MSNEQIEHALDDIMHDGAVWAVSALTLQHVADLASELPVDEAQFSYFAVQNGVHTLYEEIHTELTRLLGEGADAQKDIADKLLITVKHYKETEQDAQEHAREIGREIIGRATDPDSGSEGRESVAKLWDEFIGKHGDDLSYLVDANSPVFVDVAWNEIQQKLEQAREYRETHALAGKTGPNPVLECERSTRDSLGRINEAVDPNRTKVESADASALDKFDSMVSHVREFFTSPGDPAWLRATAQEWGKITETIANRVGWYSENKMATDNSWTGPAAEVYRDYLPTQKTAMTAMSHAINQLSNLLKDVASTIQAFWSGVTQAFFMAAARLFAVVVSMGGIRTVVNPGEIIAQVIRDLATLVDEVIADFKKALTTLKEAKQKIVDQHLTQDAFPIPSHGFGERRWPRVGGGTGLPTSKSDWKPRRS